MTEQTEIPEMDRAVRALFDFVDSPAPEDATYTAEDVTEASGAVAVVLRVIRDDMATAEQDGSLTVEGHSLIAMERYLNTRIRSLTGQDTTTGDTTVPGFAGYR